MDPIKLSICIPTYNRADYLRSCLEHCMTDLPFEFPFEIVISDNASTDGTAEVVNEFIARGAPIQYYKGFENVGPISNIGSALRLGRGKYVVYLADDDRLIGEELISIVDFLDKNDNISVCHAPWYMTEGLGSPLESKFYYVEQDTVFPRYSFAKVFNFMVQKHVFPEIAVYRSSEFRAAWVPREVCFFPFAMLAHFLDKGDVAFRKRPFYRQFIRGSTGDRPQGGHLIAMTAWDEYRGGLEYFLQFATKRGAIGSTREERVQQEQACRDFTMTRMSVAIRLLLQVGQYLKCYELMMRMEFGGAGEDPQVVSIRQGLAPVVALQTLALMVSRAAGVQRLLMSGFPDNQVIVQRLAQVGLPARIQVVSDPSEHPPELLKTTAVLVTQTSQREKFLELGYIPGLIFSQEELFHTILI